MSGITFLDVEWQRAVKGLQKAGFFLEEIRCILSVFKSVSKNIPFLQHENSERKNLMKFFENLHYSADSASITYGYLAPINVSVLERFLIDYGKAWF